jgi:hypothetical protein
MTRYIGNRKHTWLPCVINAETDDDTPVEEIERIFKATYWSDYITDAEWRALLGREGVSKSARSKLKRKAIGWFMAIGRIAMLDPDLYTAIVDSALYAEQIRAPHPCFRQSETDDDDESPVR